jgi:hypothetical protein
VTGGGFASGAIDGKDGAAPVWPGGRAAGTGAMAGGAAGTGSGAGGAVRGGATDGGGAAGVVTPG